MSRTILQCDGSGTINIGVFLPNWIGDLVMATPMLRSMREHFDRRVRLIGIMRPYVRDVLGGTNWLDDQIEFDPRAADPALGNRALVRRLRDAQLDSAVIATNSLRTAILAYAAGIPQRVGYVRYGRGPFLTERLRPPRNGWQLSPISAVDYYLELAGAMGCNNRSKTVELGTTAGDNARVEALWYKLGLNDGSAVVTISTGAAYGAAKEWPIEYFSGLAQRLAEDRQLNVIVICGPNERQAAFKIARMAKHPRVQSLADETLSIGLSKSVVKRSQLLVSNDSGPRHFGAAFDVPTVTLFGPTDPRWSHNFHPRSIDLQRNVPCGPCGRRKCPLVHHQCMRDLTIDQVLRAANTLLPNDQQRVA